MKRTTIIRYLTLPLKMQAVIILSCLIIAVPFKAWAQNAEPSEQLTRLLMPGTSTVYYFNYPTVNSAGERIVLSSALIAWTPNDDRQEGDSIIAPDYEGYGLTKDLPHPYLSQRLTARQVLDAVTYGLELYQKTSDELLLPIKKDCRHLLLPGIGILIRTSLRVDLRGCQADRHRHEPLCRRSTLDGR